MPRLVTKERAANHFQRTRKTIENWIGHGYVRGFRADNRAVLVDLDEIERALRTNSRMRDGRKVYGDKAKIVPLRSTPQSESGVGPQ